MAIKSAFSTFIISNSLKIEEQYKFSPVIKVLMALYEFLWLCSLVKKANLKYFQEETKFKSEKNKPKVKIRKKLSFLSLLKAISWWQQTLNGTPNAISSLVRILPWKIEKNTRLAFASFGFFAGMLI